MKAEHGGNRNPDGRNQHSEVKPNNISLDQEPDLFTEPPEPDPPKPRNTQHGTRKDYTLSRLKKDAPELFEQVKAGVDTDRCSRPYQISLYLILDRQCI